MGLFKRKVRVTPEAFIVHEADKSVTKKPNDLKELFSATHTAIQNDMELIFFAAFMPLLAMSLANLKDNIKSGYVSQVAAQLNSMFSEGVGEKYQKRNLEYLAAFDSDIAEGKAHLTPAMVTAALNNIVGKSDESVVMCRLGLVKVLLPTLKVDVDFYKDLKFI